MNQGAFLETPLDRIIYYNNMWVRGLMAINVGWEFRGRGSIPSECQITNVDLGQVG